MALSLQETLNLKCNRFYNYVRFVIRPKKQEAERLYNREFNSFYKWKIGNLSGDKLKEAIVYFIRNNEHKPELLHKDDRAWLLFSYLITEIRKFNGGKDIDEITHKDWVLIKEKYEEQVKRENDVNYVNVFQKGIGDKKGRAKKGAFEEYLEAELVDLLRKVFSSNWHVTIENDDIGKYNYKVIVMNFDLPQEKTEEFFSTALNMTTQYFYTFYSTGDFTISQINDRPYIEGYFLNLTENFH